MIDTHDISISMISYYELGAHLAASRRRFASRGKLAYGYGFQYDAPRFISAARRYLPLSAAPHMITYSREFLFILYFSR